MAHRLGDAVKHGQAGQLALQSADGMLVLLLGLPRGCYVRGAAWPTAAGA